MKYLSRFPLNEMAYSTEATNFEVKEYVEKSSAFNDIISLYPEVPYKIEKSGAIIFLNRVFGQRSTVEKNADGTWTFETREQIEKTGDEAPKEGEEKGVNYRTKEKLYGKEETNVPGDATNSYGKLALKEETYETLEDCLRHLWSYLVSRKIKINFGRAEKRKKLNNTDNKVYWGEKLSLDEILLREQTIISTKVLLELIDDLNNKFNLFGLYFTFNGSNSGSCIIGNKLNSIKGSLLSQFVSNQSISVINRQIKFSLSKGGVYNANGQFTIMPVSRREAYDTLLNGIIKTYSDSTMIVDNKFSFLSTVIIKYCNTFLENPNFPKPNSFFDLYKIFYKTINIVPLLLLTKLEYKGIISNKAAIGYRDDIEDFITKSGGNKYVLNISELYDDISTYVNANSGIKNIEEFTAYIVGMIHSLGLETKIVGTNIMIMIP